MRRASVAGFYRTASSSQLQQHQLGVGGSPSQLYMSLGLSPASSMESLNLRRAVALKRIKATPGHTDSDNEDEVNPCSFIPSI